MQTAFSKFFNLSENPFGETPDPDFYYASIQHNRAYSLIDQALKQGKGFSLLTGEVGTGKTLLSRLLLTSSLTHANTALILFPKLSELELLQAICEEFEVPESKNLQTAKAYIDHLNQFLLKTVELGQSSVLIIDEAQALSPEALETIRLLTNLETKNKKLLQIVLVAQPEILETLDRPDLRQLKQRISVQASLSGLDRVETEKYIKSRIAQVGNGNFVRFDSNAVTMLHELSKGIPRRVNRLCEEALRFAEEKRIRLIEVKHLKEALPIQKNSLLSRFVKGITG